MTILVLIAIIVFIVIISLRVARYRSKRSTISSLDFDGENFIFRDDKGERRIDLKDLKMIKIITTAEGPWKEDMFWWFFTHSEKPELIVPGLMIDSNEIRLLQKHLPDINNEEIIKACSLTNNREFIVWQKPD
jgi:hypothetical protein